MSRYRMTPKRRAALRKAQAASARKRRGKGKGKLAAANRSNNRLRTGIRVASTAAAIGAVAYGAHRAYGAAKSHRSHQIRSAARLRLADRAANRARVQHSNTTRAHRAREAQLSAAISHALRRPSTSGELRRARARQKLATAARGTSGSRVHVSSRTFIGPPAAPMKAIGSYKPPQASGSRAGIDAENARRRERVHARRAAKDARELAAHRRKNTRGERTAISREHRGDIRVIAVSPSGKAHIRNQTQIETMVDFDRMGKRRKRK